MSDFCMQYWYTCLFIGRDLAVLNKVNDFSLSFENAKCYEYITEKFFTALKVGMLPVVMGGLSKQDYEKIAPPDSFIHVDDFSSPKDLMLFLEKLSKDKERYNSYFWWKSYYDLYTVTELMEKTKCQLCDVLNNDVNSSKKYSDFATYWIKCR